MISKTALFFFLIFLVFFFCSSSPYAKSDEAYLDPGIPICGHLAPSSTEKFSAIIEPGTSNASFNLSWRNEDDQIEMSLVSPSGIITNLGEGIEHKSTKTSDSTIVNAPKEGVWTIELKSGASSQKGLDYCFIFQPRKALHGDLDQYSARFNGIFSDYVNKDLDGTIDRISIAIGLNVMQAGNYSLIGSIYDIKQKKEFSVSNSSYLNFGSKKIELHIFDLASLGPYQLRGLTLYDDEGETIDTYIAGYTIRDYNRETIENQTALLSGKYSDYGSDINGDGYYDYLTVDAGIHVLEEGNYSLMGTLYDSNGTELVWSMGYGSFPPGDHIMHMDFDGKTLEGRKVNGPYRLANLTLLLGDSIIQMLSMQDVFRDAYTTGPYNYTEFVDPVWPEKILSGSGSGEMLLTILVKTIIPAFNGRYSLDVVGANMPPISSNWSVAGSKSGYSYDLPGVHMPNKPNNFTVLASGVKSLNVGVKKDPVIGGSNHSRAWVSAQAIAGADGTAILDNDLISPGRYHFKIFGDAMENASQVGLEMKVTKKLVIDGDFSLALNTSGFPSGNYSINARALNGSLGFDEINLESPSVGF